MKNDEVSMKKIDCWLLALSIGFLVASNFASIAYMDRTTHAQAEFLRAYTEKMERENAAARENAKMKEEVLLAAPSFDEMETMRF